MGRGFARIMALCLVLVACQATLLSASVTAAGNGGRAVAVMEAVTGQIFLATLVARLVSAFRPSRPPGPGPPEAGEPRE